LIARGRHTPLPVPAGWLNGRMDIEFRSVISGAGRELQLIDPASNRIRFYEPNSVRG